MELAEFYLFIIMVQFSPLTNLAIGWWGVVGLACGTTRQFSYTQVSCGLL